MRGAAAHQRTVQHEQQYGDEQRHARGDGGQRLLRSCRQRQELERTARAGRRSGGRRAATHEPPSRRPSPSGLLASSAGTPSSAASPSQRLAQRPEVQRQEQREREARDAMDDERPPTAGWSPCDRKSLRTLACRFIARQPARSARSPSASSASAERREREVDAAAPQARPLARRSRAGRSAHARRPRRRTRVERRPGDRCRAMRARIVGRRQSAADRVDHRREVHDDAGARARTRSRAARPTAAPRPRALDDPGRTARPRSRMHPRSSSPFSSAGTRRASGPAIDAVGARCFGQRSVQLACVWQAWQPASPATACRRSRLRAVAQSLTSVHARLSAAGPR